MSHQSLTEATSHAILGMLVFAFVLPKRPKNNHSSEWLVQHCHLLFGVLITLEYAKDEPVWTFAVCNIAAPWNWHFWVYRFAAILIDFH
jgi:hypothetical protein